MRDRPHPDHKLEWPGGVVPEWARPKKAFGKRFGNKKGAGGKDAGKRERLQKVMAQSGYGSRRNIEILIAQGHLTINGELAKLGDQVGPRDKVKLDGNVINLRFGAQLPKVLMYHKPDNEIVTRDDPEKRATVFDKLPKVTNGRWVSVGRLDLNTSGLLLFTTNGDLVNKLTHPRFEVEREYAVRVMGEIDEKMQEKLLKSGVDVDGELCTFDSIEDRGGEGSNHWYHVVLREGRNREVRNMMEAVGLMVSRLMRVRFGNVLLPSFLKRGMFREMDEEQVQELLAFAGMNEPEPGEADSDEVEEDVNDNVGNRFDAAAEAKKRPPEPEDDIGNRYDAAREAKKQRPEIEDDIGNRGTYGEGYKPPKEPGEGGGQRRPGGKGFGFKKQRPERDGNVMAKTERSSFAQDGQGQGHRHGQGQGHGQGAHAQRGQGQGEPGNGPNRNRKQQRHKKQGKAQGQGAQGQHVQGQGHGQGAHAQRGQGNAPQGQPRQGNPQGPPKQGQQRPPRQPHQGPPQQGAQNAGPPVEGQPANAGGANKAGRNRRHRSRNRNRGPQGGPQGGPPVGDA